MLMDSEAVPTCGGDIPIGGLIGQLGAVEVSLQFDDVLGKQWGLGCSQQLIGESCVCCSLCREDTLSVK